MKNITASIFTLILITLMSCGEDPFLPEVDPETSDHILYFNSFENSDDLSDFAGYASYLSDDVTENAGDSCMVVSGGCIGPHSTVTIGPFDTDKQINVHTMAKCQYINGADIQVYSRQDLSLNASIIIEDTTWQHYQLAEPVTLMANDTLYINVHSGGIAPIESNIDLLTVEEIF